MAKKKEVTESTENLMEEYLNLRNKNSTDGSKAYFIGDEDNPALVKTWISTGSYLLDLIISNRPHGGLPVGRIVEISGEESTGKSLFCAHIMKNTIDMGGYAVYLDTEAGGSPEFWKSFGLSNNKKCISINCDTIEKVFQELENCIAYFNKRDEKVPLVICVDSIAAVSTDIELESGYGKEGFGTGKALILNKGLRKITNMVHDHNVLVVLTNQVRQKLNAMPFSDPWVTPGGKAIPFHSSVRIRLKSAGYIKDKDNNQIGTHCAAKVIKTRMGPPNKVIEEDIYYDSGINPYASWLGTLKKFGIVKSAGAYYKYKRKNGEEWQFQSKDFVSTILEDTELKDELYDCLCDAIIMKYKSPENVSVEETTIEDEDTTESLNSEE